MPTQCNTKPLEFEPHSRRRVVAAFGGKCRLRSFREAQKPTLLAFACRSSHQP